ncbi:MAG: hypothetical protein H7321_03725 [Bacteroidia bacterium]|nr:hypothetical protein [Bacteroidia bacterium]
MRHLFKYAFLVITLIISNVASAQGKGDKAKKLDESRKKYFNEKLSLTEEEQKQFWPVFDEYKEKERKLLKTFKAKYKKNDIVFMDDKKAELYLQESIKLKEDQLALYKEYVEKFKKALPIKKVVMLAVVEKEFKHEILKRAKQNGGGKDTPEDDSPGED